MSIPSDIERARELVRDWREREQVAVHRSDWSALCNAIAAALTAVRQEEQERCAKIVRGEPCFEGHYRTWPVLGDGNRSNDAPIVAWCDALADAISALSPDGGDAPTRERP